MSADSTPDLVLSRRRARRRAGPDPVVILVAAIAGLALLAGGVAAVVFLRPGPGAVPAVLGPAESREGESWTLAQFAEHVRARGVGCQTRAVSRMHADEPAVIAAAEAATLDKAAELDAAEFQPGVWLGFPGTARVTKLATAAKARDLAGAGDQATAFAWGRFYVEGQDRAYVAQLRAALR